MRLIETHKVRPDEALRIEVCDEPGSGGANHHYTIGADYASRLWEERFLGSHGSTTILFQKGPIQEVGVNGLTHEALLAVVMDRLQSFQAGPYPSNYNAEALKHVELALNSLKQRTIDRLARGVEGFTKA